MPLTRQDSFIGAWRSVTEPVEFIRLTLDSRAGQQGQLYARLTFSGVAWEGTGRLDGDSLVAEMSYAGTTTVSGALVARAGDGETLTVALRPAAADPLNLRLVRDR